LYEYQYWYKQEGNHENRRCRFSRWQRAAPRSALDSALHPQFKTDAMPDPSIPALSLLKTRVLGVLIEKQHTVPDTYPLTRNAIIAGCNQKSSRDPVLDAGIADVQAAIDHLVSLKLVTESSGERAMRYEHNLGRVLRVPSQAVALLATLFLRGAQTAGELRINGERLHKFADIPTVEGFLHDLAERPEGALVKELPRQPGSRENRWMHLLSGEPAADAVAAPARTVLHDSTSADEIEALKESVRLLQEEVAALKATVEKLCGEAGDSG
jgi:uncharacterized protein YceH (UPF0502 family)